MPQGSTVLEGGGVRSRPLRRSFTGDCRRRHRCPREHQPYTSRRGAGRQAASQENDHLNVAAVRPQGTASALWSLFDNGGKTCTASTGYGSCSRPGALLRPGPTGRFDQEYKTRNELKEERTQGREQCERGRRRQRDPTLCRSSRGEYIAGRS